MYSTSMLLKVKEAHKIGINQLRSCKTRLPDSLSSDKLNIFSIDISTSPLEGSYYKNTDQLEQSVT